MRPIVIVGVSQLLFTAGNLLARLKMRQHGFDADAFLSSWFAGYMLVRTLATFGHLWVLSKPILGHMTADRADTTLRAGLTAANS